MESYIIEAILGGLIGVVGLVVGLFLKNLQQRVNKTEEDYVRKSECAIQIEGVHREMGNITGRLDRMEKKIDFLIRQSSRMNGIISGEGGKKR